MVLLLDKKMQKNRVLKNIIKKKLKFGDKGFLIKNTNKLELIQIFFLKKILKKLFRKKKNFINFEFRKIWFYLEPNFIIQKKSKNSRMGKGKGLFERKIIKVNKNKIFIEFIGISIIKLNKILLNIRKKINIKLKIIFKKNLKYEYFLWSKKNKYNFYFKKYLNY